MDEEIHTHSEIIRVIKPLMYYGEYEKVKALINRELAYNGSSGSMNMYYAYIEYINGNQETSKKYIENILNNSNRLYDSDEYIQYMIDNSKDKKTEFKNFYNEILYSNRYKQDVKEIEDEIDNYYTKKQNDKVVELIDILLNNKNYAKYIDVNYYRDFRNNLKGYSITKRDNIDKIKNRTDRQYQKISENKINKINKINKNNTKNKNSGSKNIFSIKNMGILAIIVLVAIVAVNQNTIISMFQNQDSTSYTHPKEEIYGYYDDYDNNNIINMYDYSKALLQPKYLNEIPKLSYLQSDNVLETTINLANFQAKNFEYNETRANQDDYGRPYTPFEMYMLKSGICADYTLYTAAYLLNSGYTPYIIELEEYGKEEKEGHSFTAIEYNNNYYAIDQVNTVFNLGNHLNNYDIENLTIYKVELENNETIVSIVQDTKDMTKKRYITPYMLNLATSNLNNDLENKGVKIDNNLTNEYLPLNYKSGEQINYYLEDLAPELKYNYYLIVENELEKHKGYKGVYTTFKNNIEDNSKEYPYILEINIGY
uniref:Transglutaminase-like domain-containing protein n=2 Tax=Methanococcus voltae TaxID=2188 RepID=D7DSX0_METV3